jgi:hypothetical protein
LEVPVTPGERRVRAAALLCERDALRMPIIGTSMLPSLRSPMMLQLGSTAGARIGDVIVFRNGATHVAHRLVALDADGFVTAGDAQPHISERVRPEDVVGRVVAVWSNDAPDAVRIDCLTHRLRAAYFARAHRLRRLAHRVMEKSADLLRRADPRGRYRATPRIVRAITAACAGDTVRLAAALTTDAEAFFRTDERHRTAAWLAERARAEAVYEHLPIEMATRLRRSRLEAALGTARMRPVLEATIAALHEAGLTFALLKGAARVYSGAPDAACHPADDIDVLLRPHDVDRAVAALLARGWTYREAPAEVERFRREEHHAASLFPPGGAFPVELHHALAPPRALSMRTDWDTLAPFLVPLECPVGNVLRLDAVGTALHLGIHAIGLTRLRDIALLALEMRRLTDAERAQLAGIVRAEQRDAIRLDAAFALAARVAGVAWPCTARAAAYIAWALRREDLPRRLRERCDVVEARAAWPGSRRMLFFALVPWWSLRDQRYAVPFRIAGRCVSNAVAALYAAALPAADETAR